MTFKKSSGLGEKNSHFCLVYGKVHKKISISLLFHVQGNGSYPGLNFHILDVEIEPAVLKEIPPLLRSLIPAAERPSRKRYSQNSNTMAVVDTPAGGRPH